MTTMPTIRITLTHPNGNWREVEYAVRGDVDTNDLFTTLRERAWAASDYDATAAIAHPMKVHINHQIDFSSPPSPMGFETCSVCKAPVTQEQWSAEQCPGKPITKEIDHA